MAPAKVITDPGYGTDIAREKSRMREILKILGRLYPEAECSLKFESPFQLLVATILSAQCTDARVNQVTPALFAQFPNAESMARGELAAIENFIRSTNFYKSKARALRETSTALVEKYGGKVPQSLELLTELRGVGRKTANVVLGVGFGIPGLVVDTHVGRLSRRLGFTRSTEPSEVEEQMMNLVPREAWISYAHWLISHGRAVCTARQARCDECHLLHYCPRVGVAR
jgi:endonuclease-3